MSIKLPFDLEKALSGKYELITRNNKKVLDWHYFSGKSDKCISLFLEGEEDLVELFRDGSYYGDDGVDEWDLFLIPKKKKVYLTICKNPNHENNYHSSYASENKEKLSFRDDKDYQLVEIELEESEECK